MWKKWKNQNFIIYNQCETSSPTGRHEPLPEIPDEREDVDAVADARRVLPDVRPGHVAQHGHYRHRLHHGAWVRPDLEQRESLVLCVCFNFELRFAKNCQKWLKHQ